MKQKGALLCFLLLGIIFLGGCQTAKGAAYTVGATAQGIGMTAQGVAKDSVNFWQGILKLDAWMQDNLW